jgi:hypothetical protein
MDVLQLREWWCRAPQLKMGRRVEWELRRGAWWVSIDSDAAKTLC